jgi:hypothetical protein
MSQAPPQQPQAGEASTSGFIGVIVCNYAAHQQLMKISGKYIDDQVAMHNLRVTPGPLEPGTQGFTVFLTYRHDVAAILIAPLKTLPKSEYPNLVFRSFFTNQDASKSRKYNSRGRKKNRGRGNSSRGNGALDLSDTSSVHSSYSNLSSYSNRSSSTSIDLEGLSERRFAVWIDGKGISRERWLAAKPPPGGKMNWWASRNRRRFKAFVNFDSAASRDRWYVDHPSVNVDGRDKKVYLVQ